MEIVVIGAGNVATHLAKALDKVHNVVQVFSPTLSHAQELNDKLRESQPIDQLRDINRKADLYIISVSDDAIPLISHQLGKVDGIVAHTSGSVPLTALEGVSDKIGVFYPLQTFSKDVDVDLKKVTIFNEADNDSTLSVLDELAQKIAKESKHANSEQRRQLHIAAVFACNFTNYLWSAADDILHKEGFDFEVLSPLLHATLEKALSNSPQKSQTGPAARKDIGVIESHLKKLDGDYKKIYQLLSNSIIRKYNK